MTAADFRDVLDKPFACLTCFGRFAFGDLVLVASEIQCPTCGSANLHPADRAEVTVPQYIGEIGTQQ